MRVTGLMIQYYFVCKRELWFFSRGIGFGFENEDMLIGRAIHREAFSREWKEVLIDGVKLDMVKPGKDVEVVEVKKSSRLREPAKWQLKYYLYILKGAGIRAKGVVSYPKEGKTEEVELTDEDVEILKNVIEEVKTILSLERPPKAVKKSYCRGCSYRDFCEV